MVKEEIMSGDVFKFVNEGDSIEGTLTAKRESTLVKNDGTKGKAYDIDTADGKKTIFGTTILDRKLAEVKEGTYVTVEYVGTIPTKRGIPAKDFKVFVGE